MKIAIVHDWLTVIGGAEKVLIALLDIFPEADLYALMTAYTPEEQQRHFKRPVRTSFLQRMPFVKRRYRGYLPLMPLAIEQLDLAGYDVIISSCSAVAKGVIAGPDQIHICYIHSPIRYAWDLQNQYLREAGLDRGVRSWVTRAILHYIRNWDARTGQGVDHFIANSAFIARRVQRVYRRQATIIYPPVNIDRFTVGGARQDYYFTASRMVPYKKIPLIAEAFSAMPERRLLIGGDGPQFDLVKAKAGPNVEVLGALSDAEMVRHMQSARAFVFAAEEDFGIVPLEAQACGTPVIAYGKGGALETVRGGSGPGRTGVFFDAQTQPAIIDAVDRFEDVRDTIRAEDCRAHAETFSEARFRSQIENFFADAVSATKDMLQG